MVNDSTARTGYAPPQRESAGGARPPEFPTQPVLPGRFAARYMKDHCFLPLAVEGNILRLAMGNPSDRDTVAEIELFTGLVVEPTGAEPAAIVEAVERLHGEGSNTVSKIMEDMDEGGETAEAGVDADVDHLRDMASEAPVIRMVNLLIDRAVEGQASDIHFEPFEERLLVRYRVDGILHEIENLPKRLQPAVVSRVKIMARMNIAERRLPQDGRIRLAVHGRDVDIRVSTVPTVFGESLVLRLLDRSNVFLGMEELGFPPDTLERWARLIRKPYGMVLVTGPTGSGKTTTLYGALSRINSTEKKIITVEDPVEYQLEGVNQIQVKPKIGLDFASGLRSIVRQDPDIIMVGEIRDRETAEIAIQSALTGHLVFSTVHTNDAAGAVTRLRDMGIESYLISSSVLGILAQRLVRRICSACRVPDPDQAALLNEIGVTVPPGATLVRGTGCPACGETGYRGRVGIFELLTVTDEVRRMVMTDPGADRLRELAQSQGMVTLREDGLRKVFSGQTTAAEVVRVTREE